jgi:large repetitive protein
VPPFFVVRAPAGTTVDPARDPEVGVSFTGTRKDVTVEDVVAALGPRRPATAAAPRGFRQAFVLVAVGEPAAAADVAKVEQIRAAWEPFFVRSTEGRGSVDARLR